MWNTEHFIIALHELADNCECGTLRDEVIHDCLVVGIRDSTLSECLQLDTEPSLEEAKIHQWEAVHEQQQKLNGPKEPSSIAVLHLGRGRKRLRQQWCKRETAHYPIQHYKDVYPLPPPRNKCPAKYATCHRYNKKGHYGASVLLQASCCFHFTSSSVDVTFLDNRRAVVNTHAASQKAWLH